MNSWIEISFMYIQEKTRFLQGRLFKKVISTILRKISWNFFSKTFNVNINILERLLYPMEYHFLKTGFLVSG